MQDTKYSIESISVRFGLLTTVGLLAYFLIMKFVGLVHIVELRTLNFLVLVIGIYKALKAFQKNNEQPMGYLQGWGIGCLTSSVAVLPFALFIFIYLQLDPALMEYIRNRDEFGRFLNPYMLAFVIAFEGIVSGLVLTFILLQWMMKSHLKGGGLR
ncbi:MAG TPA: DUF4199 domain-containing protein [Cyclobacteriaceae bacterium]|jgi:hypothetical protein